MSFWHVSNVLISHALKKPCGIIVILGYYDDYRVASWLVPVLAPTKIRSLHQCVSAGELPALMHLDLQG